LLARRELVMVNGIVTVMVAVALAPVVGIVLVALQRNGFGGGVTSLTDLTLGNFTRAWSEGHMADSLRSTATIVVFAVPVATTLSVLAGYAFATMRWPGQAFMLGFFVFALMIPIEGTLIPLYFILRSVGLTDSYWGVIVTEIGYHMPFGVFWMAQSFRAVPFELVEAARVDGAGTWSTLRRVVAPVGLPAIKTLMALQFMWMWNDFLMPLVMLSSQGHLTATASLSFFVGQYITDYTAMAAASVMVALPVVVTYVLLQRSFIEGFSSGAIKG
jgi:raffinose/stachyose/melibiose transport system permease protein